MKRLALCSTAALLALAGATRPAAASGYIIMTKTEQTERTKSGYMVLTKTEQTERTKSGYMIMTKTEQAD